MGDWEVTAVHLPITTGSAVELAEGRRGGGRRGNRCGPGTGTATEHSRSNRSSDSPEAPEFERHELGFVPTGVSSISIPGG